VASAVRRAIIDWEAGDFSWVAWEADANVTRRLFAKLIGAAEETVSLAPSLAAAASTVAQSLPVGRVVVGAHEWRSNLFPWLALSARGFDVAVVPAVDGVVPTDALIEAVDDRTTLLAVSDTQSATGYRVDVPAICRASHAMGTRVFVDITQSLGALRFDVGNGQPDYVAAHGYKWLLCPRGAAWLYVSPELLAGVMPLAPSWKSAPEPRQLYGPPLEYADSAARLDTSLAWFSWIGARAALGLVATLDAGEVERKCLALGAQFRDSVGELRLPLARQELPSHIQAVHCGPDATGLSVLLKEAGVIAALRAGTLRVGFHAFNDEADVAAAVDALKRHRTAPGIARGQGEQH
jgi:selenocysteine lyase/cysteine desulfurase